VKTPLAVLVLLSLSLATTAARAQPAVDAGGDLDVMQAEVDRDYAQAMASDCTTACHALESMKRATDRLCVLDPGDRCAKAKQKLGDATTRVRTACPACAEELSAPGSNPVPTPAMAPPSEALANSEAVHSRGGCGGCASATGPADAVAPVALLGLAVMTMRRRRR
jgi:MYXO-CTERM domain-containing protein